MQGLDGDKFEIGWGVRRATFAVSKPPRREGGQWKRTVDGVELTRLH